MTGDVHVIDLAFQGIEQVVAAFAVEADEGLVLVETGPHSSYERLEAGLGELGFRVRDVADILLTHIHFDHAGAAWAIAASAGATVHVHPRGAKHLIDPERLYASATRIYGEAAMRTLWGEMRGIPERQVRVWEDGHRDRLRGLDVRALHTPGHATHHIAWIVGGAVFLGDVGGVQIGQGPIEPPCPPPDIHLDDWRASIERLRPLCRGRSAYLTHFGRVDQPLPHLTHLRARIDAWETEAERLLAGGEGNEEHKGEGETHTGFRVMVHGYRLKDTCPTKN